jgi:diguanylate cyclase (GGDEF)-like protein/PAS domain S-box-containing protein
MSGRTRASQASPEALDAEIDVDRADAARATIDALTDSTDVFETFFDAAPTGLALADLSTHYVRVNQAYAQMVGRPPEDLIGAPFSQVLHPDDVSGADGRTTLLLSGQSSAMTTEQRYVAADGTVSWVMHGVTVVPDAAGQPAWFAVSAQDITSQKQAEDELRALSAVMTERAVRDPLTGLANRVLFEERLRSVLARDGRTGDTTGLLFLDLDGFKAVNDEQGHAIGDAVLRAVAGRLKAAVRPSDTAARLGGDEFVVIVESTDGAGLDALVSRLKHSLSDAFRIGDLDLEVGVSIGTALSVAGRTDPAALVALADRAMYDAKKSSRGGR